MSSSHAAGRSFSQYDPVWNALRQQAETVLHGEPLLSPLLHNVVLNQPSLEAALAYHLSGRLSCPEMNASLLRQLFDQALHETPALGLAARADMVAVYDRDAACHSYLEPLLYFKGFHALQSYRLSHWLWQHQRRDLALFLQNRISETFGVDIHPAARIGQGILMDHATGIVIGETAVVEDDVSLLHSVTLGGTGKESGDRHPKVRQGVLIGAGSKILGNVEIGAGARVGAGSVVLEAVPPHSTVVGVPARVVGSAGCSRPSHKMDHCIAKKSHSG